MMKNAPKAYNLAQQYMCCIENNVTTLPKAYNAFMGGRKETKGFTWATVQKYRMYWEKRDTIKEYWRTHATDPKEIEMCNVKDWTEGYNGKPTEKKTSATPTPTPSAEVDRLVETLSNRLTAGLTRLELIGVHYQFELLPKQPPGPNRDAINTLINELQLVKHLLTHDDVVLQEKVVPQLE